jgi:hypothetical protein
MGPELDGNRSVVVLGIDGRRLRLEDLPPPGTRRWVIRRKAEVVAGVRAGLISLEEACARYTLSVEEFLSWQRSIDRHGMRGLGTRLRDIALPRGAAGHAHRRVGARATVLLPFRLRNFAKPGRFFPALGNFCRDLRAC